jgi:pimeloyl-ACP methyl ester carboxylesterase
VAGQSWGGNVVLEFGVRYPELACGLAFIDGGFLDLQQRPDATWEKVAVELKPPDLNGTPREQIKAYLTNNHPDWDEIAIEGALANFETLPDGTIRPWLTWPRHKAILWALWEQQPTRLYSQVTVPVLICPAEDPKNPTWMTVKAKQVAAAQNGLPYSEVHWFENSDHDLHLQRPQRLADLFSASLRDGLWLDCQT